MAITGTRELKSRSFSAPWLWTRFQELLVLQGPPSLGMAFAFEPGFKLALDRLFVFSLANCLLVAYIFLFNDWADVSSDRSDPYRAPSFISDSSHRAKQAFGLFLLGAVSVLLFSLVSRGSFQLAAAIAMLGLVYSWPAAGAKKIPFASSGVHLIGGTLHFLLGCAAFGPLDGRALALAPFFGLTFAAGHLNQEVRDRTADRLAGVSTHATRFGQRSVFLVSQLAFGLAFLHLALASQVGVLPKRLSALLFLYPIILWSARRAWLSDLDREALVSHQRWYRGVYAVAGAVMLAEFLWS